MSGNTAFFDVSNFSSRIAKKVLASPNKFEVVFTNIPGARNSGDDETQLNLMCFPYAKNSLSNMHIVFRR